MTHPFLRRALMAGLGAAALPVDAQRTQPTFAYDWDLRPVPSLATAWEQSGNGLTLGSCGPRC
ncbi:ABC-type transport system substrate-binding protein [Roseococcus suduntuyensis]|uniref:ABC-type transport system substrate-binding protein n=1 Tax=Roseococcus suduntuyensis TaxID=455361 RepID=A0A840AGE5_9PROT|nr:ABC-type transport system substrate-binding protein [Roseococcus suduntuyensis]